MRRGLPLAFRPRAIRQHYDDARSLMQSHGGVAAETLLQELVYEAYLALFASFEGTIRREFDHQIEYGAGSLGIRCRALRAQRGGEWTRFDEILDCWKVDTEAGPGIEIITNHQAIRDWLAHGRSSKLPDNGRSLLDPVRLFADLERASSILHMPSI
jgi:hypothetical protein